MVRSLSASTPKTTFSKEEKVAFVMLIIAGISGLFFGMKYLSKNLNAPFVFTYSGTALLTASQQEEELMATMKTQDTDGDTLNDYDEQYLYKTSPYIADSDSDGYDDAAEVASGNDPTCPVGKDCGRGVVSVSAAGNTESSLPTGPEPSFNFEQAALLLDSLGTSTDPAPANDLSALTPDQLRQALLASGVAEEKLDQVSDEQLLKLYQDILAHYQATQSASTP